MLILFAMAIPALIVLVMMPPPPCPADEDDCEKDSSRAPILIAACTCLLVAFATCLLSLRILWNVMRGHPSKLGVYEISDFDSRKDCVLSNVTVQVK